MMRFIVSVLGFAVAVAVFFIYTKPTYDSVKLLQLDIGRYDEALTRANELQSLKQSLLSRFNAFNPADIEKLIKLLPDHVDNVRLVLDFDNLASTHGLPVQNVVIGRGSDTKTAQGRALEVIGGNEKGYDSLTLKFSTQGTYPAFVRFMEEVQRSLRIVDLVALTLTPATSVSVGDPLYQFDVTIRTYWLK